MDFVEEYNQTKGVKMCWLQNKCFNKEALRVAPTLLGGVSTTKG